MALEYDQVYTWKFDTRAEKRKRKKKKKRRQKTKKKNEKLIPVRCESGHRGVGMFPWCIGSTVEGPGRDLPDVCMQRFAVEERDGTKIHTKIRTGYGLPTDESKRDVRKRARRGG